MCAFSRIDSRTLPTASGSRRSADPRLYAEVADLGKLRKTIESYLEDYNAQTNHPMKLTLFLNAIEHVSKISRILRQPKGNALLLGVGGSGRQSLTRLAVFCGEMEEFQIQIAKVRSIILQKRGCKMHLQQRKVCECVCVSVYVCVCIQEGARLTSFPREQSMS